MATIFQRISQQQQEIAKTKKVNCVKRPLKDSLDVTNTLIEKNKTSKPKTRTVNNRLHLNEDTHGKMTSSFHSQNKNQSFDGSISPSRIKDNNKDTSEIKDIKKGNIISFYEQKLKRMQEDIEVLNRTEENQIKKVTKGFETIVKKACNKKSDLKEKVNKNDNSPCRVKEKEIIKGKITNKSSNKINQVKNTINHTQSNDVINSTIIKRNLGKKNTPKNNNHLKEKSPYATTSDYTISVTSRQKTNPTKTKTPDLSLDKFKKKKIEDVIVKFDKNIQTDPIEIQKPKLNTFTGVKIEIIINSNINPQMIEIPLNEFGNHNIINSFLKNLSKNIFKDKDFDIAIINRSKEIEHVEDFIIEKVGKTKDSTKISTGNQGKKGSIGNTFASVIANAIKKEEKNSQIDKRKTFHKAQSLKMPNDNDIKISSLLLMNEKQNDKKQDIEEIKKEIKKEIKEVIKEDFKQEEKKEIEVFKIKDDKQEEIKAQIIDDNHYQKKSSNTIDIVLQSQNNNDPRIIPKKESNIQQKEAPIIQKKASNTFSKDQPLIQKRLSNTISKEPPLIQKRLSNTINDTKVPSQKIKMKTKFMEELIQRSIMQCANNNIVDNTNMLPTEYQPIDQIVQSKVHLIELDKPVIKKKKPKPFMFDENFTQATQIDMDNQSSLKKGQEKAKNLRQALKQAKT